jgi:hypothetical protein
VEVCLFFFMNCKGTQSQEEYKTIFSDLKICKMALSNQIDFPAFFHLRKMTYWSFINSRIRLYAVALCHVRWPYAAMFRKLTFWNWHTAENQCKSHREYSELLKIAQEHHFGQAKSIRFWAWCNRGVHQEMNANGLLPYDLFSWNKA